MSDGISGRFEDYSVPSTTDFYNNIVSTRNGIFNIPMGYCLSNYCCINTIIKPFSFATPTPPSRCPTIKHISISTANIVVSVRQRWVEQ